MKIFFISIILFLFSFIVRAQYTPLVNENNTWKCLSYGWGTQHFDYVIDGDSLVNFVPYKIMWNVSQIGDYYYSGLLREDTTEQQVYFNYSGTEMLLYDFSLEAGDAASVYGIGMMHDIVVTEVTTAMVGGEERKKIVFDEEEGWGPGYWIEGVGSEYGLPDAALGMIVDYNPYLTCFYEGNDLAWDNPDITDPVCGTMLLSEEMENASVYIYPNPATDQLRLSLSEGLMGKMLWVEIYSVTGQLCFSEKSTTKQFDISELMEGVYAVKIMCEEKFVGSSSLIVQ